MIRLRIHVRYRGSSVGATLALLLAALLTSAALPPAAVARAPVVSPDTAYMPSGAGLHYYLTKNNVASTGLTAACSAGYFAASFHQIHDVSALIYDFGHPNAYTKADSGKGPPSGWWGWVRTGYDSSTSDQAGSANCANWTSASASHFGTAVQLSVNWGAPAKSSGGFNAQTFTCNAIGPVWCARYLYALYLPALLKH